MDFVSFEFYVFLVVMVAFYYILPLRVRWFILLAGSFIYYYLATGSIRCVLIFACIIAVTWMLGLLQEAIRRREVTLRLRQFILAGSIFIALLPLLLSKFVPHSAHAGLVDRLSGWGVIGMLGLSFFTMQIVAYLTDVYRGKISAQRNPLYYALFVSFFPQIIQGPIPRYDQLQPQLIEGHRFDDDGFVKGFMQILWGFFLKLMIADKANIVVNTIFDSYVTWQGYYVLVAGILYSIQLYADFLACITLAQGVSELFGIHLSDNFKRPYFASSVKDFWGRWHISLSSWLRDYIYIPLGGNRKGRLRRYINLVITFLVSAVWHGVGGRYVIWGMMHASYEIAGDLTSGLRDRAYQLFGMEKGRRSRIYVNRFFTFAFVMMAWIIFRADTLSQGVYMLRSMFTVPNVWILFNGSLLSLGLDWTDWMLLIASIMILIVVGMQQEKGIHIRDAVLRQPLLFRWGIYILVIVIVMVFGTYGYGYDAADFIYGGF